MPRDFVHLHVHSDLSMLDGLGTPVHYVERAKQLGQPAIAITDHGNLCGAPEFYFAARKAGVEPILGCEFYFVPEVAAYKAAKGKKSEEDGTRFHVTILARGEAGYSALSELSTESYRNFYYKPLVDHHILGQADIDNLVVLSGCANSVLSKALLEDYQYGDDEVRWWKENIPNFYIEIMHHNTEFDDELNRNLLKLAKQHNIPYVITNDPHYVEPDDCTHHDALLALQTNAKIDDPNRMRFDGEGYWLKGADEMLASWKQYSPAVVKRGMANSTLIAQECRTRIPGWEKRSWHIPRFPGKLDAYTRLEKMTYRELRRRELGDEYEERARYELKIIKQTGIADFLLITRDCIRWASSRGIPVGPGRGSVCGTLVGYLVGIHKIDPVRYDLLFERFLNPARPSMPDIDTDFGQERREELFEYVIKKYGAENVVHVCAFQKMKMRRMFTALAKMNGVSHEDAIKISKQIPDEPTGTYRDSDEHLDVLIELIKQSPILETCPDFVDQLLALAGVRSSISQHPAGVIIAPAQHEIRKHVPEMYIPSSKKWVGQFDLAAVEHMGYLKQDFLGLRTLDTIVKCCEFVEEAHGIELDPDSWVPDEEERDEEVYAALSEGDTAGVFQMEGGTNSRGIQEIGCTCFEDIVSCTSLYRTGPIMAGFPADFVANRSGGARNIPYADGRLSHILGTTWGVILYQEQVMEIARALAGFSMESVDDIKEAIKHKKSDLMVSLQPAFVKGWVTGGGKKAAAEKIWKQIEGYSGYSYNRSHAVAYSMLSYQTARLKLLYPAEFYAALIATNDDKEKRYSYLRAATLAGIKIRPPDINKSERLARPEVVDGIPAIRLGLQDFAGVGDKKSNRMVDSRPRRGYGNPAQVAALVDIGTYRVLVDGGALRSLGEPGKAARMEELLGWQFRDRLAWVEERYPGMLDEPDGTERHVTVWGELVENTPRQTRHGKPYRVWTIRRDNVRQWKVMLWSGASGYFKVPKGAIVMVNAEFQPAPWDNISVNSLADPIHVLQGKRWRRAHKIKARDASEED